MKLHYRILGEGPSVLIFHGLFGMSDNWQSFGRELASLGYRVILADLRNHGHSPHDPEFSYAAMAGDIEELTLDACNGETPFAIGHSMGGKCIMKSLENRPELFRKAVVVDIAPWLYPVHHGEIIDALNSIDLQTLSSRNEADVHLALRLPEAAVRQFLLKNLYRSDGGFAWRFNLEAITAHIGEVGAATWPEKKVLTPLLFIRGTNSSYIDPLRMPEIYSHFPGAVLKEISGAGHWVHADRPLDLLEAVTVFFHEPNRQAEAEESAR